MDGGRYERIAHHPPTWSQSAAHHPSRATAQNNPQEATRDQSRCINVSNRGDCALLGVLESTLESKPPIHSTRPLTRGDCVLLGILKGALDSQHIHAVALWGRNRVTGAGREGVGMAEGAPGCFARHCALFEPSPHTLPRARLPHNIPMPPTHPHTFMPGM